MTMKYCVGLMGTLLDMEWQQAADAFKADATSANWGRMERIMDARQCWAVKDDADKELRMLALIRLPIPEWIGELHKERAPWGSGGQAAPAVPTQQAPENLAQEAGFQEGLLVRMESEGFQEAPDKNLARLRVAESGYGPWVLPR
jgi:hypothetical protein